MIIRAILAVISAYGIPAIVVWAMFWKLCPYIVSLFPYNSWHRLIQFGVYAGVGLIFGIEGLILTISLGLGLGSIIMVVGKQ